MVNRQKKLSRINKKVIKIAHIHVWDKKNKGDHAIVIAVQELLKQNFKNCQIIDFPVETLKFFKADKLKKINSCDFLIIGGGGIFYSYFLPFDQKMIKAIKIPIVLFGLGYIKEVDAPLWPSRYVNSVMTLAKQAKLVGVRDINTKRFLIKNGLDRKKIEVVGDPAVVLSEKKPSPQSIKKLKLHGSKIRLGVNLNYSGWLGFGKWREDILRAYQETIKYFQEEYNAQIYYLKHHPGEENIYKALNIKNIVKVDLPPNEQKYVYAQMDLIIGMMLHVGVMSFGALTPEISVAYDIRNYGFAEFINHPELVVDLDKLKSKKLLKTAKQVFSKRKKYKNLFYDKKQEIALKEANFLKAISLS